MSEPPGHRPVLLMTSADVPEKDGVVITVPNSRHQVQFERIPPFDINDPWPAGLTREVTRYDVKIFDLHYGRHRLSIGITKNDDLQESIGKLVTLYIKSKEEKRRSYGA